MSTPGRALRGQPDRHDATIIDVAKKVPEEALQEDEKLLLWYDQAVTLSETGG